MIYMWLIVFLCVLKGLKVNFFGCWFVVDFFFNYGLFGGVIS